MILLLLECVVDELGVVRQRTDHRVLTQKRHHFLLRYVTVDKRADLWAFGVVLYEMLTGTRPFEGATISDTLASVLKTDPNWNALPAETPAAIRRLLRRCLEKDRKRRLDSAADARLEIDDALAPPSGDAHVVSGVDAKPPGWRRALP